MTQRNNSRLRNAANKSRSIWRGAMFSIAARLGIIQDSK
jgi:hypothetical protein